VNYDPAEAKLDNSSVFDEYRQGYDLYDRLSEARQGGVRHTRRQLREIAGEATPKSAVRRSKSTSKPTAKQTYKTTPKTTPKTASKSTQKTTPKSKFKSNLASRSKSTPLIERRRSSRLIHPAEIKAEEPQPQPKQVVESKAISFSNYVSDDEDIEDAEPRPRLKLTFNVPAATITHPSHLAVPEYGSLDAFLSSFVSLDEDISSAERDAYVTEQIQLRKRIEEARQTGVFAELELRENVDDIKKFVDPTRKTTHNDHLVSHAIYFARLMMDERRAHATRARKISNMVDLHFKRLSGAEEKERKQWERLMRQLARRTAMEVLKKWKLAEKVVLRRRQKAFEDEQIKKGKLHLNQILEQSAQLLEARTESMTVNGITEDIDSDHQSMAASSELEEDVSEEGASDEMSTDDEDEESDAEDDVSDEKLSVEELRRKYAALEDVQLDDLEENDAAGREEENDDADDDVVLEAPADEALELYAAEEDHGSDESVLMDSELEEESENEDQDGESDESAEDGKPSSLAMLMGHTAEDVAGEADADQDDEAASVESEKFKLDADTPGSSPEHEGHKIITPFLLRGTLREYQRDGLDWLAGLYHTQTNGILADEMGLGKTIQTISLISYLACEKEIWGPHLIVVPTSVMLNWEMEFKRFAPGFKVLTYYGNPAQRKDKRKGWNNEDTWHVCITSYQLVLQDQNAFKRKRWRYMILDEAHNIKNFRSQRWQALLNFNSERRLLLTGTPLQNNLVELWSLLYFLMPSSKGSQMMPDGFANLKDFQEWFARPVDRMVEGGESVDDEARATVTKLHQVLRPYLLRRLKRDVEKQMPAKYEHIVYCRLSKRQRYLYDDFMSRAQTKETLASGNFLSIINCLMQLRKVCNHPDLFEVRPIVTSLALRKSIASDFEPTDLLIRKRLMEDRHNREINLSALNLRPVENEGMMALHARTSYNLRGHGFMAHELAHLSSTTKPVERDYVSIERHAKYKEYLEKTAAAAKLQHAIYLSMFRCSRRPIYGEDLIRKFSVVSGHPVAGYDWTQLHALQSIELSYGAREEQMSEIITRYSFVTPKVVCLDMPQLTLGPLAKPNYGSELAECRAVSTFHLSQVKLSVAFPDKRLLQYDCGKLQRLAVLMRDLVDNGHRALIFTQMTRVLDILEQFLNIHGWRYLRLDGATKIEQRQILTERFNTDTRIPVFILSTRSGGLGINLTGADTVIFYDSDWNPSMDKQCQDRCHRIGQTRDVHIYRFVSEYTIESNILKKATQKTILDNVVIQEGDFTTDYFHKMSVKELVGDVAGVTDRDAVLDVPSGNIERTLAMAEDADDVAAASVAMKETNLDVEDFVERTPTARPTPDGDSSVREDFSRESSFREDSVRPESVSAREDSVQLDTDGQPEVQSEYVSEVDEEGPDDEDEVEHEIGHIDDYMIRFIENGWFGD
jgi:helicase SWR1